MNCDHLGCLDMTRCMYAKPRFCKHKECALVLDCAYDKLNIKDLNSKCVCGAVGHLDLMQFAKCYQELKDKTIFSKLKKIKLCNHDRCKKDICEFIKYGIPDIGELCPCNEFHMDSDDYLQCFACSDNYDAYTTRYFEEEEYKDITDFFDTPKVKKTRFNQPLYEYRPPRQMDGPSYSYLYDSKKPKSAMDPIPYVEGKDGRQEYHPAYQSLLNRKEERKKMYSEPKKIEKCHKDPVKVLKELRNYKKIEKELHGDVKDKKKQIRFIVMRECLSTTESKRFHDVKNDGGQCYRELEETVEEISKEIEKAIL